ncbi:MAG: hypothetical protein FGM37_09995 [Phycisphaerales bacterium]|nr:hypothetical protein [Phycisphaerales bacterium]
MKAPVRRTSRVAPGGRHVERVVALNPVAGDPQRVRVMVRSSGGSRARCACAIVRDQAPALRIRVGAPWSDRVAARVARLNALAAVRDDALHEIATSRRALPAGTLARKLGERGHAPRAVSAAIRQLRSDGWIGDSIRTP